MLSDGFCFTTLSLSLVSSSDSTWSHGDIKNSLTQTGENESTSATKHYDAFGNETSSTGTWEGAFQYGGPFGYQTDTDSDLKLLGHRYYDSSTGRLLTRDRIGFGRNWYAYGSGDPIGTVDVDGLAPMGPPPVPVPGDPGNQWVWNPDPNNRRGGTWGPARPITGQGQPTANWEAVDGHWDVDNGKGNRQRYTKDGKPVSGQYAHGKGAEHYRMGWGRYARGGAAKIVWVLLLYTLLIDGADAAFRDIVFADEVEAGAAYVKKALDPRIDNASEKVGGWYRRRSGFTDAELAEYGLDY